MTTDRYANSTSYVHPQESNLLNTHKAMEYAADGKPHVRVTLGSDNITITGDVNLVDNVRINNSTTNPVPVFLTNTSSTVYQGTIPWATTVTNWPALQTVNGTVYAVQSGTWNVVVTNFTSTVHQGTNPWTITGTVNIGTIPEVEIKNDTGNPISVSANTTANSSSNPLYVNANISNNTITTTNGDVAVTAFEEPLAVGITPIIQADVTYGVDPDFWVETKLNGGDVTVTSDNTWQVQSGTSAGGYARLATSKYMTYQPGQGSMFRWTAAFTTATNSINTGTKHAYGVDNIVQNTGPLDREDGYGFGFSGATDTNGHRKIGILHRRAGRAETRTFTVTTAPTGAQTAVFTLNGVQYTISLTASTDVRYTANQIADRLKAITSAKNTWDIEGCNGIVTFTYYSPGPKSGTYSFSCSGTGTLCAGTLAQTAAGVTPTDTWTYVDSWDNQDIQFDPTKLNVFGIDFRWLGAGRVRFFMEDPATGRLVLVHTQRWASQYLVPHITRPSLRLVYRSGTTNPAITPSQNVVITGASVFAGVQGMVNQTGSSQGAYSIDSTTRNKDIVYHLMSLQNPFVRNGGVNKASLAIQTLTVAAQGNDPSVIYIVKNAIGLSDVLVFRSIPNTTVAMFAQYSTSVVQENLDLDRICNVQTLGINGNATFDLMSYNLNIAPGETVSVFISSSNAINRTATGLTWNVD
jgi:hypothetical protein